MTLASLHHIVMNAFKDTANLNSLCLGQQLKPKTQHH
jgi:hypothetical protein